MLIVPAFAKVNLTLEVLGKRADGYHEIRSVLQTIDLHDTLTCRPSQRLELASPAVTANVEDNLVFKAAKLLQEATGCDKGAALSLTKGIPAAAGLGGGSSDAAAALRALDHVWGTGLSRPDKSGLAARLGSDVPFFLYGGTALARGRGELLTPLPDAPALWLVILRPPLELPGKTARLYSRLEGGHFTQGQATDALVRLLQQGDRLAPDLLYNVFESVAFDSFPGLEEYRQALLSAGAGGVHLAGSGPSLFTVAGDGNEAQALCHRLASGGLDSYVTRTVSAAVAVAPPV